MLVHALCWMQRVSVCVSVCQCVSVSVCGRLRDSQLVASCPGTVRLCLCCPCLVSCVSSACRVSCVSCVSCVLLSRVSHASRVCLSACLSACLPVCKLHLRRHRPARRASLEEDARFAMSSTPPVMAALDPLGSADDVQQQTDEHRRRAEAAKDRGDWTAMVAELRAADAIRPGCCANWLASAGVGNDLTDGEGSDAVSFILSTDGSGDTAGAPPNLSLVGKEQTLRGTGTEHEAVSRNRGNSPEQIRNCLRLEEPPELSKTTKLSADQ